MDRLALRGIPIAVSVLLLGVPSCSSDQPTVPDGPPPSAATPPPPSPHVASTDERAGVPSFVWADPSRKGTVANLASASATDAARTHLRAYAPLYRLPPKEVDSLELRDLHDTGRGPIVARFARRIGDVEVWNEVVSVAMDRKHEAIALTGFVTGDAPALMKSATGTAGRGGFTLSMAAAAAAAIGDLGGTAVDTAAMAAPRPSEGGYQEIATSAASSPVRVKKTWFRTDDHKLVDAYYLEVDHGHDAAGTPQYFGYVVSATDGTILFKNDLTAHAHPVTYRVWADSTPGELPVPFDGPQGNATTPLPGASPNNYNPDFVPSALVTLSSLTGIGVHDDWLPVGATETLGNNVDAYADITNPDGFTPGSDFRANITTADTFDRIFDLTQAPASSVDQQKAAITQLFYNINFWHDWYYVAGFDERSGNAQSSNYGRGGVQGDPIRGEAQDVSGKNNANMSTPADGARPRMQMFLWDFGTARLTMSAPTAATFTNVGLPSAWGSTNYNIPDGTPFVRAVPNDACAALTGTFTGMIVVVDRGTCGFSVKAQFAQNAGAAGVIIANVATSANPTVAPGMTLTGPPPPTIPAMSVNLADGTTLRDAIAAGPVVGGMARTSTLRDGDLDSQVMAHEWGHYISNRLVFNANGLGSTMARGLGEGWADTHALLMMVRRGDDLEPTNATFNGVYAVAGYSGATSARGNPYYYGIRRYPYSTDMTKNPLTFKHIGDGNPLPVGPPINGGAAPNAQVHNTGEVWATMLWECYAALLRDTQGAGARLTFDQARDRFRDYLVASYKLTPANPTLLEARDAFLAVALASDLTDYTAFTRAFAKRGAGVYAVAPDRNSATNMPVVEDFNVGAAIVPTTAIVTDDVAPVCNADGVLDNGEIGTLTVSFRNVGNAALASTAVTVSSATAGITFPDGATLTLPAAGQFQTVSASLPIAMNGLAPVATLFDVTITVPDLGGGAPAPVTLSLLGNYDVVGNASYLDTVETPATAWQVVNSPATMGVTEIWQRVTLAPNNHRWSGASATQAGTSDLVSPAMYVLPEQPFVVSFRHRYSFESPVFDGGVIELSSDGGATWTDVGAAAGYNGALGTASANPLGGRAAYVNQSTDYPAYSSRTLDLGLAYAGRRVKLRFRVASDAGTSSPGWDVDDIQVAGVSAPPFDLMIGQPATCNNAPVANAGLSRAVDELTPAPAFAPVTVTLDGSASFDADGHPMTFQWRQTSGPPVTLSDVTARQPTFTAPLVARAASPAQLVFQLNVFDGTVASAPVFVGISITNVNRPPVANAGAAQLVAERTVITLDGGGSTDPDADDTITYLWSQTAGPVVTLSSTTARQPTFTAPDVAASTALTFRLVVNDGLASSAASAITVTLSDVNQAPVASAGVSQTVAELTPSPELGPVTVTLDASASLDPEGSALTYAWTQTGGPPVTLSDATARQPTFTAPAVPRAGAVLTFAVVASDGAATSVASTATVTVTNVNRVPVAQAGPAQAVAERTLATLDGSTSADPDSDDTLTYEWSQTAGTPVTLSSATAARPTFTTPEVTAAGTDLGFQLIVDDGLAASVAATMTVRVSNANRPPVAAAGPVQTVVERTLVTLAGAGTDPDGDAPLTYLWTAPVGVTLSSTTAAAPTFTAPDVTGPTTYTFTLVVEDASRAASAPATVAITVTNVNRAPVASAGSAATVRSGDLVALRGSAVDPDAETHFAWAWTAPAGITLSDATSATPTFVAPAVTTATPFEFSLVVTDASGLASAAATVTITVQRALRLPTADAGVAIITAPGQSVRLDGSNSRDPDGRALTHQWTQTAGPTVELREATTATPTFTAPAVAADTVLTFQLVVTNADAVASPPATVSVFVQLAPTDGEGGGGCGCRTGDSGAGLGQILLAGLPLLVLMRRRRARRQGRRG